MVRLCCVRVLLASGAFGCGLLTPAAIAAAVSPERAFDDPAPRARATDTYGWARASLRFVRSNSLLPEASLAGEPSVPVSRNAYAFALVALDALRSDRYGSEPEFSMQGRSVSLADAPAGSLGARLVGLGWMLPSGGRFAGSSPITADDASYGVVGTLGLSERNSAFAGALRATGLNGSRRSSYAASHVLARRLGLRYNHLQGAERFEVGPGEPMSVAHVAYLLHHAALADPWRADATSALVDFSLPARTPRQQRVVRTALSLIGQPYVWAGESERQQPEGHPGFDCSGFVWRVVTGALAEGERFPLRTRTSMSMSSEIPRSRRVTNPAKLRTGDILFWGYRGTHSRPAENYHTGLYLGDGWFIHSSGGNDGVSIDRLEGFWLEQLSWGRRVIRS